MSGVTGYKCPNCGATLSYDIEKEGLDCTFCKGFFKVSELEQKSDEEKAAPKSQTNEEYGEDSVVYSCPNCAGRMITDKNTVATFCAYCHNPGIIQDRLKGERRPELLIPFKIPKENVIAEMERTLRFKPLLPKDIKTYLKKGEVSGLYVPFWLFDGEMDVFLSGTGTKVTSWRDSKYIYTKTDTYRIERAATFPYEKVPVDGSSKMDDDTMRGLEPFGYEELKDFSGGYLSGHFAEGYDVGSGETQKAAEERMRKSSEQLIKSTVSGYTGTNIQDFKSRTLKISSRYVMLPVWSLAMEYKGKTYSYMMNAQTGKVVGKLPISIAKIFKCLAFITLCASMVTFAGLFFGGDIK